MGERRECSGAQKPSDAWALIEPTMRSIFEDAYDRAWPANAALRGVFADRLIARIRLRASNADAGNCDTLQGKRVIDVSEDDMFEVALELGLPV